MKSMDKAKIEKFINKYAIYFILLGMIILLSILKPGVFLTSKNLLNIIRQMTPIGLMALGVTFCIITTGTDLSGGSVIALCTCVVASLAHPAVAGVSQGPGQFPLIVALLAAVLVGAVCGLVNGVVISFGNVPPFIATLGMMSVARGFALIISNGKPIGDFTNSFKYIGEGVFIGIPMPVLILALFVFITYVILHKTKFGTYVYAIGGNENAAVVSGINVKLNKTLVYTLAGAMTGVAGIVLAARTNSGQPGVGVGYDMDAITCAIIGGSSFSGGVGTILGTVVGAMIMGVLTNGMTMLQINPNIQMIVKGCVIVCAVLLDESKSRKKN